jgi:protein TonB
MSFMRQREPLLLGALIASVLLHLLLGALLAWLPQFYREPVNPEPIFVEVVPPLKKLPSQRRELDLPAKPAPPVPRETPARRLAEQDQVAKRETAPKGEDDEDRQRSTRAPRAQTPPAPARTKPAPPVAQSQPAPPTGQPRPEPQLPPSPQGIRPATVPAPARTPSLKELTTLPSATVARMESNWRRKYREGIEKGDTVWLDTEQDLLISFFKRFKTNIYNVWNYPERAKLREEEGQCLLRIVVSRQGGIDAVELLESSGSYDLDEEALRAVRKGAPYGPLPAAYPHPQLNIMAYFRYSLNKSFKYPGRISGER